MSRRIPLPTLNLDALAGALSAAQEAATNAVAFTTFPKDAIGRVINVGVPKDKQITEDTIFVWPYDGFIYAAFLDKDGKFVVGCYKPRTPNVVLSQPAVIEGSFLINARDELKLMGPAFKRIKDARDSLRLGDDILSKMTSETTPFFPLAGVSSKRLPQKVTRLHICLISPRLDNKYFDFFIVVNGKVIGYSCNDTQGPFDSDIFKNGVMHLGHVVIVDMPEGNLEIVLGAATWSTAKLKSWNREFLTMNLVLEHPDGTFTVLCKELNLNANEFKTHVGENQAMLFGILKFTDDARVLSSAATSSMVDFIGDDVKSSVRDYQGKVQDAARKFVQTHLPGVPDVSGTMTAMTAGPSNGRNTHDVPDRDFSEYKSSEPTTVVYGGFSEAGLKFIGGVPNVIKTDYLPLPEYTTTSFKLSPLEQHKAVGMPKCNGLVLTNQTDVPDVIVGKNKGIAKVIIIEVRWTIAQHDDGIEKFRLELAGVLAKDRANVWVVVYNETTNMATVVVPAMFFKKYPDGKIRMLSASNIPSGVHVKNNVLGDVVTALLEGTLVMASDYMPDMPLDDINIVLTWIIETMMKSVTDPEMVVNMTTLPSWASFVSRLPSFVNSTIDIGTAVDAIVNLYTTAYKARMDEIIARTSECQKILAVLASGGDTSEILLMFDGKKAPEVAKLVHAEIDALRSEMGSLRKTISQIEKSVSMIKNIHPFEFTSLADNNFLCKQKSTIAATKAATKGAILDAINNEEKMCDLLMRLIDGYITLPIHPFLLRAVRNLLGGNNENLNVFLDSPSKTGVNLITLPGYEYCQPATEGDHKIYPITIGKPGEMVKATDMVLEMRLVNLREPLKGFTHNGWFPTGNTLIKPAEMSDSDWKQVYDDYTTLFGLLRRQFRFMGEKGAKGMTLSDQQFILMQFSALLSYINALNITEITEGSAADTALKSFITLCQLFNTVSEAEQIPLHVLATPNVADGLIQIKMTTFSALFFERMYKLSKFMSPDVRRAIHINIATSVLKDLTKDYVDIVSVLDSCNDAIKKAKQALDNPEKGELSQHRLITWLRAKIREYDDRVMQSATARLITSDGSCAAGNGARDKSDSYKALCAENKKKKRAKLTPEETKIMLEAATKISKGEWPDGDVMITVRPGRMPITKANFDKYRDEVMAVAKESAEDIAFMRDLAGHDQVFESIDDFKDKLDSDYKKALNDRDEIWTSVIDDLFEKLKSCVLFKRTPTVDLYKLAMYGFEAIKRERSGIHKTDALMRMIKDVTGYDLLCTQALADLTWNPDVEPMNTKCGVKLLKLMESAAAKIEHDDEIAAADGDGDYGSDFDSYEYQ